MRSYKSEHKITRSVFFCALESVCVYIYIYICRWIVTFKAKFTHVLFLFKKESYLFYSQFSTLSIIYEDNRCVTAVYKA